MSTYGVNELCYRALHDDQFLERLRAHPEQALEESDLTSEEREWMRHGDVAALYLSGAHEYLLLNLARMELFGLSVPDEFSRRIRAANNGGRQ